MTGRSRLLLGTLLFAALAVPALAQTEEAPERRLDLGELRELREEAAENATCGEELRASILGQYDAAITALGSADAFEAQTRSHEREKAGVGRMVDALRAELERPEAQPRPRLPDNATVDRAESELERERARLAANRAALRDLESLSEERSATRNEISRRLGGLDQTIESINDELRANAQSDAHPELKKAARNALLARREASSREMEAIRGQLELRDAQRTLLPWRIDLTQRRVAYSELLVAMLEDATRELRHDDARRRLREVIEQCEEAAAESDALKDVAEETRQLAEMLWGPEGIESRAEKTARAVARTRKNLSDFDRIIQLARRKYEAFGRHGSLQRWWPEIPDDFPKPGELASLITELEQTAPQIQHDLIRLEQQRSAEHSFSGKLVESLEAEQGEELDARVRRVTHELLDTRRELLDELIRATGRYSNQVVELESVSRRFMDIEERVRAFLHERLLWVRSVPKPIFPAAGDIGRGMLWLVSASDFKETVNATRDAFGRLPGRGLGFVVVFALLLGLRRRMRRRLETFAQQVAEPETDSFGATLGALVLTVLLAAPLPLAFELMSALLAGAGPSTLLYSSSEAFGYLASIAALFEITRQGLAPHGLAEAHFRWPARVTRPIHRGLLWREATFLPLIYVAIEMGMAGMRLDSPKDLQVYNNSLGRVAFVLGMVILGVSLLALFRPRKRGADAEPDAGLAWLHRLYMYAYPVVLVTTLVPAALAAIGYYITGFLLAYQMLRTVWLLTALLIASELLFRWRTVGLRRASDAAGKDAAGPDIPTAETQVRKLFRFAIVLAAAIGLYGIWSDAVPTLEIMKRIQIWPRVALTEPLQSGEPSKLAVSAAEEAVTSEPAPGGGSGSAPGVSGVPVPAAPDAGASAATESFPLTLWNLLEALLAATITVVLVKNLPGLLELILARRTTLDHGARIALGTLVRYTIIIVGVSVAFSLLGVSWSKIQWLAAALTFGLGFGLQEIVANFVSGLILLVERPVRVGDAVTVGNLQGIVSRIQIRATTISLWDKSEMIVPNKEFITTKLVNWTLSDSKRRIDIPLRIAYGADLEKVKGTLLEVATDHPDVLDDPPPQALLLEFGNDAIKFELRYFVDFGIGLRTRDELHMRVDRAFRERGIDFALPKLDIRTARTPEPPKP